MRESLQRRRLLSLARGRGQTLDWFVQLDCDGSNQIKGGALPESGSQLPPTVD